MIKTTYKLTKDKNLVWNQYTLFDSSRFIHSDCESSPVKMAMPTGEHCWKKNSGAPGARTSNLRSFGFQVLHALHCAASEDLWSGI